MKAARINQDHSFGSVEGIHPLEVGDVCGGTVAHYPDWIPEVRFGMVIRVRMLATWGRVVDVDWDDGGSSTETQYYE